jgi:hypothetical protein
MRFWSAYRLAVPWSDIQIQNIVPALNSLDAVAAYDHRVPQYGLWHVDREALLALEHIYWYLLGHVKRGLSIYGLPRQYLISPAPEYSTYEWRYRNYDAESGSQFLPAPAMKLSIDPDWLATKLREQWPNVRLNIRKPRPQTYLLDWQMKIGRQTLIGGLHRDQYAVVLTGDQNAVVRFAAWYRSIFPAEQYLFLYEWAGLAIPLKAGDTAKDIHQTIQERNTDRNAIEEREIDYPWPTQGK